MESLLYIVLDKFCEEILLTNENLTDILDDIDLECAKEQTIHDIMEYLNYYYAEYTDK